MSAILALESLALVVTAAVLLILTATHTSTRLWAALTVVVFALIAAAVLGFGARGLLRLQPGFRSPVLLLQLLTLPVTYSLGFQAGRLVIALPIMAAAVSVIVLLFTPSARQALDRTLNL